jgi:beta-lactamase superfamily II metal-dependent hydrolase
MLRGGLTSFVLLVFGACLPAPPGVSSAGSGSGAASSPGDGTCGSGSWRPGWLEIHHIDAGEAVSTLVVSPIGRSLLIDAGEAAWDRSDGAVSIGRYVRSVLGCAALDYVLLSHFHVDHTGFPGYGGVWHLAHVQGFRIGALVHRDLFHYSGAAGATLSAWRDYLNSDEAVALHPELATVGIGQILLGGGVLVAIVATDGAGVLPAGDLSAGATPPDENDYSIALVLRMGRLDYFTAGDLSGDTVQVADGGYSYHDIETRVAPLVKDIDVYRVSHHASRHASNPTLLAELRPRVSIVQVADGNSNGHPAQVTVDRLLAGSALYLTERGDPGTALGAGKVVGHVVLRTATGLDYTIGGDRFVASDPTRTDHDGDGYFQEADPDDDAAAEVPAPVGGCDLDYQSCARSL